MKEVIFRAFSYLLPVTLFLCACGKDLSLPSSSTGSAGTDGAAGKNGSNGKDAPQYVMKDANGSVLPGVVIDSGSVWNVGEGYYTSYQCQGTSCGMLSTVLFFTTMNCTGSPYFFFSTSIRNQVLVVANNGSRWTYSGAPVSRTSGSTRDNSGACSAVSLAGFYSLAVPYNGVLPMSPPGPYTLEEK